MYTLHYTRGKKQRIHGLSFRDAITRARICGRNGGNAFVTGPGLSASYHFTHTGFIRINRGTPLGRVFVH